MVVHEQVPLDEETSEIAGKNLSIVILIYVIILNTLMHRFSRKSNFSQRHKIFKIKYYSFSEYGNEKYISIMRI